ncbi:MAG: hypothetical protein Q9167_003878 [Letrouitia subvulpina]
MNRYLDLNAPVTASLSVEEPMASMDDTKLRKKPKKGVLGSNSFSILPKTSTIPRSAVFLFSNYKLLVAYPARHSYRDKTGIQSPSSTNLVLKPGKQKALHCTDSEGLKSESTNSAPPQASHTMVRRTQGMEAPSLIKTLVQALAVDDPRQHIDAVSETTQPITSVVTPSDHVVVTQINMAFHRNGRTFIRIGKLDTAAEANIISQQVVEDLGLQPEAYNDNFSLSSIGGSIQPLGVLKLDWNVMGKTKTYTNEFFVVNKNQSKAFDILISEGTIKSIGFFKKNVEVWCLELKE